MLDVPADNLLSEAGVIKILKDEPLFTVVGLKMGA